MLISNSWFAQVLNPLLNRGTPTDWPTIYALIPQNGGREILRTECGIEVGTREETADKKKAIFACPGVSQRILAQIQLDSSGNWTKWSYLVRGQNFSHRTSLDKGIAVFFNDREITPVPFQEEREIEEAIAGFLKPLYPEPVYANLYDLDVVEKGKKVQVTRCVSKGDIKVSRNVVSSTVQEVAGLQRDFDCPSFDPILFNPFTKRVQAGNPLYSLGSWSWRRFSPTGSGNEKADFEAKTDESLVLSSRFDDKPLFHFETEEQEVEQLIQNVFEPPPPLESLVSPYGQGYRRRFSPAVCRIDGMIAAPNLAEHFVTGACEFHPGESFKVTLKRDFNQTVQGETTLYEVSEWNGTITTPTGEEIETGALEKGGITLVEEGGSLVVIQHENEEERLNALQKRFDASLGDEFFPTLVAFRGGLGLVSGNQFRNAPPGVGDRISEEAQDSHEGVAETSNPNDFNIGGRGILANLGLQLYPISLFSETNNFGLFVLGGAEAGYAGSYQDELTVAELQLGAGLSLREFANLSTPFDLSGHLLLYRHGWTSNDEILPENNGWGVPQFGGCLEWNRWGLCVDYSRHEKTEELPSGEAEQGINFLKINLGYSLRKHRTPKVEIVR